MSCENPVRARVILETFILRKFQISYRTFVPVMVTKKILGDSIYETQVQTMKRAAAWCNATGM